MKILPLPQSQKKFLCTFSCCTLALSLLSPAGPAGAQEYLGKVCLTGTVTERESGQVTPESVLFEYEVVHLGGGSYSITGYVNTGEQPFVATGAGITIGNEMLINVNTSQTHSDSWHDTGINQTRLNLTTMQGTFYEIGHDFNTATKEWDSRYTAGTVALTTCP